MSAQLYQGLNDNKTEIDLNGMISINTNSTDKSQNSYQLYKYGSGW